MAALGYVGTQRRWIVCTLRVQVRQGTTYGTGTLPYLVSGSASGQFLSQLPTLEFIIIPAIGVRITICYHARHLLDSISV